MITIKNVYDYKGDQVEICLESPSEQVIDASHLTLLPALIDPHVHLRVPGAEHKEDWIHGARAAIAGGITTVFDMPNNDPSCVSLKEIQKKKQLVACQLQQAGIPLRSYFYLGVSKDHLDELPKAAHEAIGFKVFMGSSTGDLLVDDPACLEEVFAMAKELGKVLAVHCEDEGVICENKQRFCQREDPSVHSLIRARTAAIASTEKALSLAKKFGTRLCILHTSTKEELGLIRAAKKEGVDVYMEVAPHHLFLDEEAYDRLGNLGKINPPLRTKEDRMALWKGVLDGTVDFIGSDHAPHTLEEKRRPYREAPAGVPGLETTLALLLDAHNRGWISLSKIVELMRSNIQKIFRLADHEDVVLVDTTLKREVSDKQIKSKCGWSPYRGMSLTGWPVMTITHAIVYDVKEQVCKPQTR